MRSFFEWFRGSGLGADDPWLILGKGPSFAKRAEYDLRPYRTLSLNHAVREQPVTLAHMIDLDVAESCANVLEANAEAVVMPWVPHVNNTPGPESLNEAVLRIPVLRRLSAQGRLLWYNLCTTPIVHGDAPVVAVQWFSSEAVLNLLAMAGVRRVRSLGIDGGATYSNEFDDLKDKTLLANGHESFDRQFAELAKIILRTGLDYAPLDAPSPIRVYVGTLEEQMLAVKVLEYSIRKHASMTVEVFPLHRANVDVPKPQDACNTPRTPFSFQRFLIPRLAGYRGRAIYLDSDMQLFRDIRRLWTLPFGGADLLAATKPGDSERRPQFSVMLLDCEALSWDIGEIVRRLDCGELNYERLMYEMAVARHIRADIGAAWNSLERYEPGRTALLHYTDMPTQPWVSRDNPLGYLWVRDLLEAIDRGFITPGYVEDHVARGWVRPSLLYQVAHRAEDSLVLPRKARLLDRSFIAPYQRLSDDAADGSQVQRAGLLRALGGRILRRAIGQIRQRPSLVRLARSIRYRTKSLLGQ